MPKALPRITKPKLESVRIIVRTDEDPDLSWIGSFNDKGGPADRTIDHRERGGDRRAYRFFVAANGPKETGNPESVEADYQRMVSYGDSWAMVGLWVEADVLTPSRTIQKVRSGGLWGVESDSGQEHFASIVRDELSALRAELKALGVRMPAKLEAQEDKAGTVHGPILEA